jgi:hypothetical protein
MQLETVGKFSNPAASFKLKVIENFEEKSNQAPTEVMQKKVVMIYFVPFDLQLNCVSCT